MYYMHTSADPPCIQSSSMICIYQRTHYQGSSEAYVCMRLCVHVYRAYDLIEGLLGWSVYWCMYL